MPTLRDGLEKLRGRARENLQGGPETRIGEPLVADPNAGAARAPSSALKRISRGTRQMERHAPRWRELWAHFDGEQFTEVSAVDNTLQVLETREGSLDKPRYRSRLVRNRMTRGITAEVSMLTGRFPVWEATPTNADPETEHAARTSEKVLLGLHDKLKIRRLTFKTALNSAVTGDGYAWAYWDASKGVPIVTEPSAQEREEGAPDQVDSGLRTGEIAVAVLRQDQVVWEPGVEFEDSRWYGVRLVKAVDAIIQTPGYIGPAELKPDAIEHFVGGRDQPIDGQTAFYYHYLERPSPDHPKGRWLQICNGWIVQEPAEYPRLEDEPVIHRLPWIERGARRDRSLGLGEQVIDIQRSINRIVNQLIEWRNLVLNPQVFAPEGAVQDELTAEPGALFEYRGNQAPTWREVPEIPVSLFKDLEQAYADMDYVLGGGGQLPAGIEAGSAIQEYNERELSFRAMLIANLADFYSSLGKHLLYLVAKHYTEERLLEIKGRFGTESIPDFLGETLHGKVSNIRVSEASITPRTRAAQEAKIMAFADKGWITPAQAMAALNGGTADWLIDRFELDIARVHRQIQGLIRLGQLTADQEVMAQAGPDALMALIPEAKPQVDNHEVFVDIITDWMKTVDFEGLHPLIQTAAENWLAMHQYEIEVQLARQAQQLMLQAGGQGMGNAGRPQEAPGQPSQPSIAKNAEALQ